MSSNQPGARHEVVQPQVVVVGARCAGAATALHLARAGHDVLVVDRAEFPSDTLSTHAIARGGVVQLARWGLLDDVLATGAPPVRQVTFGLRGEEKTLPIKEQAGVDHVLAPRRHVLDALLLDAAAAAGATVRTGVTVTGVRRRPDGRVVGLDARTADGGTLGVHATHVVGADGVRSRMARWLGAPTQERYRAGTATFYAYVADVDWPAFEFHVSPKAFAGVFPTHGGEACVWLAGPTPTLSAVRTAGARRAEALVAAIEAAAPTLGERVRAGRVTSPVRGSADLPNHLRRPIGAAGAGWALVGDAGYHRDPITGHGITDAFRDAELLAVALDTALRDPADSDRALATYHARRDAALRETFDITRALTAFPNPERFVELQIQLSEALEREAEYLAALPAPAGTAAAAA